MYAIWLGYEDLDCVNEYPVFLGQSSRGPKFQTILWYEDNIVYQWLSYGLLGSSPGGSKLYIHVC